jgi:hypothetical protein
MILQRDEVVKLCLESFYSGNLTHFQLEQRKSRKSNWFSTRCEQYRENKLSAELSRAKSAKISILPMPVGWH